MGKLYSPATEHSNLCIRRGGTAASVELSTTGFVSRQAGPLQSSLENSSRTEGPPCAIVISY